MIDRLRKLNITKEEHYIQPSQKNVHSKWLSWAIFAIQTETQDSFLGREKGRQRGRVVRIMDLKSGAELRVNFRSEVVCL